MANPKQRRLGKGLAALISPAGAEALAGAEAAPNAGDRLLYLDPRNIRPNPKQPRVSFDEDALAELAESIRRDGVQEPVIVREVDGAYELVSGERRVRASVMADLEKIPAVCRDVSDRDMLKLGLIENIQRENLNPLELAQAYRALLDEFEWTHEELSRQVGKKRATVTNTLRILDLPEVVQQAVACGDISLGHAKALLAIETPLAQAKLCRRIIQEGLSVRQAEKLAQPQPQRTPKPSGKDANVAALEDELRRRLGTKVSIKAGAKGRGRIEIEYFSLDELERLLGLLRPAR